MTKPDPHDLVPHTLRALARSHELTPECLDDETLAALADGTLATAARDAVLPHLASCSRCRGTVASVARALADPAVAREVSRLDGSGLRRIYRYALPLAAAAGVLLVLTSHRSRDDGGLTHRAPPVTAAAPVPLSPVGSVAEAKVLQWTAVTGAVRYRLTLSDASGQVLYEGQPTDTVAVLPDSIVLVAGRSYLWMVEADIGFDRWATSRLVEFSIAVSPPP